MLFLDAAETMVDQADLAEFYNTMGSDFVKMRENGELIDVVLVIEGNKIPCHRLILASKCEYFRAMFSHGQQENASREIKISGISYTAGAALVDYFYRGKLEVNLDSAVGLLVASNMLLLDDVNYTVEDFLAHHVDASNCVDWMKLAHVHCLPSSDQNLLYYAYYNVIQHFEKLSRSDLGSVNWSDMWAIMNPHNWEDFYLYYSNKHVAKFRLVQAWANANENNKQYFPKLVQRVNLLAVSYNFFFNTVYLEKLMHTGDCQRILDKAKQHMLHLEKMAPVVVIFEISNESGDFELWMMHKNSWEEIPDVPCILEQCAACAVPGGFVITGGYDETTNVDDVHMYHSGSKTWEALPSMMIARKKHRAAFLSGALYVVGGSDAKGRPTTFVERYDFETGCWCYVVDMPARRLLPLVEVVDDELYVFGGSDRCTDRNSVYKFSPSKNQWEQKSNLLTTLVNLQSSTVVGSDVYFVGGIFGLNMRYDTVADKFTSLMESVHAHDQGTAVEWNGDVLLLGALYIFIYSFHFYCHL